MLSLTCFLARTRSTVLYGSMPHARRFTTTHTGHPLSCDTSSLPSTLLLSGPDTERHYRFVVDDNGRLYSELTPRRTIATAFKDTKFLDFFFTRLLPSRVWWQRRLARGAAKLKPSPVAPALNELPAELDTYFARYPYVSVCGTELNWVSVYTAPIVFTDLKPVTDSSSASAASAVSGTAVSSPRALPWELQFAGGLTSRFDPTAVCMDAVGRVWHPLQSPLAVDTTVTVADTPTGSPGHSARRNSASTVSTAHEALEEVIVTKGITGNADAAAHAGPERLSHGDVSSELGSAWRWRNGLISSALVQRLVRGEFGAVSSSHSDAITATEATQRERDTEKTVHGFMFQGQWYPIHVIASNDTNTK